MLWFGHSEVNVTRRFLRLLDVQLLQGTLHADITRAKACDFCSDIFVHNISVFQLAIDFRLQAQPSNFRFLDILLLSIIPPGKIFLHPHIQADKEVASTHLLNFEFGHAMAAVAPGDRNRGEAVAAHDGL